MNVGRKRNKNFIDSDEILQNDVYEDNLEEISQEEKSSSFVSGLKSFVIFSCFFVSLATFILVAVSKIRSNISTKVSSSLDNKVENNDFNELKALESPIIEEHKGDSSSIDNLDEEWNKQYYEDYDGSLLSKESEKFNPPLVGKIIKKFSKNELLFSKTMGDYRTHSGIDIETSLGSPVKAIEYGTVEKVFENDEKGVTVVLSHANNIKSVYSNLQDIKFIEIGKKVNKGEIIGGVGNTSLYESEDPTHLHFEILINNETVDPMEYIDF